MNASVEVTPGTSWSERLRLAGQPAETAITPESELREQLLAASHALPLLGQACEAGTPGELWSRLEHLLWNELLPLQDTDGRFAAGGAGSHEEWAHLLLAILAHAMAPGERELRLNLAVNCSGQVTRDGETLEWQVETAYPRQGITDLTLWCENELDFTLLLRVDPVLQRMVSLLRNGTPCGLEYQDSYLRLEGPWRSGDHVQLRHATPFRVAPRGQKAIERAYPGAANIQEAIIYHGLRELAAWEAPGEDGAPAGAATRECMVGVRKDGVLLLPETAIPSAPPFSGSGDFFRTLGETPVVLAARAVLAGPSTSRLIQGPIGFAPYETAFDRGA